MTRMGYHYGPCTPQGSGAGILIVIALIAGFCIFISEEVRSHIHTVEHVVTLIALGIGSFTVMCIVSIIWLAVHSYRADHRKTPAPEYAESELVDYHPAEEDAIKRARELL